MKYCIIHQQGKKKFLKDLCCDEYELDRLIYYWKNKIYKEYGEEDDINFVYFKELDFRNSNDFHEYALLKAKNAPGKFKNLLKNPNISKGLEKDEIWFHIQPYNRELNLTLLQSYLRTIIQYYDDLKEIFNKDAIVICLPSGYYVDGLSETNNLLMQSGSILHEEYSEKYRTL